MHSRLAAATAVTAALLAAPAGAGAATTCELASGVLDVTMSASNDTVEMSVASGQILVFGSPGAVACAGAAPTVSNTNAISIHNLPGRIDNDVTLHAPNTFAPGLIAEAGDDEIEIFVNLNDGESSELRINPPVAGGTIVLGTGGINPNATIGEDQPDADIIPNMVPILVVNGRTGPDFVSAQGQSGTGGPLMENVSLHGGGGVDSLGGGEGNDVISGTGSDLRGYGGNDLLIGGSTPGVLSGGPEEDRLLPSTVGDVMLGGDGPDTADYSFLTAGVTVELGTNEIENLVGTTFDDVLRGNDGPNVLVGLQGNDVLEGRGGIDDLRGREGNDSLEARDGGPDSVDCGLDTDTVTTDPAGVDTLTGCENVLFPGLDSGTGGGGPGGGGGGDATPASMTAYRLSASTFAAASKGPSVAAARKAKVGTTVRYRLSETAVVSFAVERATSGRRVNGKCRAPTRRNRQRKPCTRYRALKGSFTHTGRQGPNSFKFRGRLRGRKLSPGRYRLVATAMDTAGNRSKRKRLGFRIVDR